MKNLFFAMLFVAAAAFAPVFARSEKIDPRLKEEFASHFAGAENVKWSQMNDGYHKASFILNGINAEAYFDEQAKLTGTVRNLLSYQLPLAVFQTVSNRFTDAVIIEIREIIKSEGTIYRILLEQKDKRLIMKVSSSGSLTDARKERTKK